MLSSTGAMACVLALTACSSGDTPPSEPTAGPDDSAFKPALTGLVVTEPQALATVPYARFGTINTTWAEVEPRRGEYDFSAVDATLTAERDIRFRLRIRAGNAAPDWLKDEAGGCVPVDPSTDNGASGCTVRFWQSPFLERFALLMQEVARRYEGDWQVVDVANGACSTAYAEPFILGVDGPSLARLADAGLTTPKHRACIVRSTEAMMSSFTRTRVSISGHGAWEFVDGRSWDAERALLNQLRERYPDRLVLEDHGLGPDDEVCPAPGEPSATASSWHCYLAGLPAAETPHGWQLTLNDGLMSDAAWAGIDMGACYLEYAAFQQLSEDERQQVHDALVGNCPG